MLTYLLKRLLFFIPTLLIVALVVFGLSKMAPGDNGLPPAPLPSADYSYKQWEKEYLQKARQLHLDKPTFYFSFCPKAYPDTLHRIVRKDNRKNLEKLIGQYGNWNDISNYYHQIRQTRLAMENWPDTIALDERISINRVIPFLFVNYKDPVISSLLDQANTTLAKVKQKNSEEGVIIQKLVGHEIGKLTSTYQNVKTTTTPNQLLIPALHWHGLNNQFHIWLSNFLNGEFGVSLGNGRPVVDLIKDAIWWTLMINLVSMFLSYLLSIPLGVYSAMYQGKRLDRIASVTLFLFYSIPAFWLATMLVVFFTTPEYGMHWFSSIGLGNVAEEDPFWARFFIRLSHLILPIFCVTYASLAFTARQIRGGLLDVVRQDYIRTAKAKGLSNSIVIWKHAFRNALFPLITHFATIFPAVLSGSLIIEVIFNIPGMGRLLFDSIFAEDWPIVFTLLMMAAVMTMIGNLIGDILYVLSDPRVTFKKVKR